MTADTHSPRRRPFLFAGLLVALMLGITGCGEVATLPGDAGFGPTPVLTAPSPGLLPIGGVLVAVDAGNIVWRVTSAAAQRRFF